MKNHIQAPGTTGKANTTPDDLQGIHEVKGK
jgi:hypothetical protein